jgi:hypothetical protein
MVDIDGHGVPLTPLGVRQHRHLVGLIDGNDTHVLVALIHRQGRPLRTEDVAQTVDLEVLVCGTFTSYWSMIGSGAWERSRLRRSLVCMLLVYPQICSTDVDV